MKHLFLSGHGGWKPDYGYTKVPRGVSVYFYTHFAKNLMTGMERQILAGTFTKNDRIITEFSQCPNMKISGQPDDWTTTAENALNKSHWGNDSTVVGVPEGEEANLSELFDAFSGDMRQGDEVCIHWIACSTLQLKQVGGRAMGLNAGDFQHNPGNGRYRIRNPDGSFRWI